MDLTSSFLKILLIVVNLFFALTGLVLIIVASLVISDTKYFSDLHNDEVRTGAIIIIVLGVIIMAVAVFGLYSVLKKSPRLLKIYGGLVLLIFIAEIALVICFFAYKPIIIKKLSDHMHRIINGSDENDLKTIDAIQRDYKCCGVESPADWIDQSPTQALRNTCCVPEHIDAVTNDCKDAQPLFKDKYYQVGCLTKLTDFLTMNADLLTYVLLAFAILQLIFIIAAFFLANYYEKKSSK